MAISWTVPPVAPTDDGFGAQHDVVGGGAADGQLQLAFLAPPESGVITLAVPDRPSATRRTVTRPLFVRASAGSMRPSVVVKVTSVPFCTGVPAFSVTVATMSTPPLSGTEDPLANSGMVDSVGAVSGTLSQATDALRQQRVADGEPANGA